MFVLVPVWFGMSLRLRYFRSWLYSFSSLQNRGSLIFSSITLQWVKSVAMYLSQLQLV